MPPVSIFDL